MWSERTLSVLQALHLVGLMPCLFIIILLFVISRQRHRVIIPGLYFFTLSVGFLRPLTPVLFPASFYDLQLWMALFYAGLPALAYLLMLQLMRGKMPKVKHWLVYPATLALQAPAYLVVSDTPWCVGDAFCVSSGPQLQYVLVILISAILFLPLLQRLARFGSVQQEQHISNMQKYWLLVALLLLHVSLPLADLFYMLEKISLTQLRAIHVTLSFSFIYLVLTSLFRLFDDVIHKRYDDVKRAKRERLSDQDMATIEAIERLMSEASPHRTMALTRGDFSEMAKVAEHKLSRLLNVHFGKNFNEFMNHYRIEEAKQRLKAEPNTSVTVIAFEVGFSSIATFNRVFKAETGLSPTAYRNG